MYVKQHSIKYMCIVASEEMRCRNARNAVTCYEETMRKKKSAPKIAIRTMRKPAKLSQRIFP